MSFKLFIAILMIAICAYPLIGGAADLDDMLAHQPSPSQSFWGYQYKNIKWINHTPVPAAAPNEPEGGQIDVGKVDSYGDGKEETVKVTWGGGVSDHSLKIEVVKDEKIISTLQNQFGIQPNFKIEDVDGDGRKEIVIWSGLWDPRLPGEDGVTEATSEGHSEPHRYVVATYKLIRDEYSLWSIYTTRKKYGPFCKDQPDE